MADNDSELNSSATAPDVQLNGDLRILDVESIKLLDYMQKAPQNTVNEIIRNIR
jgi:hypothetical protein